MEIQIQRADDPLFMDGLADLLLQLADDDFISAYRGSEWLGLAPHIEADIAFASISQDTMGHAVMFYKLAEEIGLGLVDELAHARPASARRNSILLELVNGPGSYLEEPRYDWAFAVVRSYFYTVAKKIKMASLSNSSHPPLAAAAARVNVELYYHHIHWKTWFTQLMAAGGESRRRMDEAISKVLSNFGDVFSLGTHAAQIAHYGLIEDSTVLETRWVQEMEPLFATFAAEIPETFSCESGNGRMGEHTKDLEDALMTLSEVYRLDPAAAW